MSAFQVQKPKNRVRKKRGDFYASILGEERSRVLTSLASAANCSPPEVLRQMFDYCIERSMAVSSNSRGSKRKRRARA